MCVYHAMQMIAAKWSPDKTRYTHIHTQSHMYMCIARIQNTHLSTGIPVAGAREGGMVLGVRSALPPAHSRTEGK